jgi:Icc-related predicted phosphoesterase
MIRLVAISDTHNRHDQIDVPDGDVLVHGGDFTGRGTPDEIRAFNDWLGTLPHRHKVVIAGNHDWGFQISPENARAALTNAIYLEDSGVEIEGLRFYGSPWQPWFMDWAFNLRTDAELRSKWDLIPEGTDVLITHGPPRGILDRTVTLDDVGCLELRRAVERIAPRLHIFGHIHEGYGQTVVGETTFVNASTCNLFYRPVNPPVVLDLEPVRRP